LLAGLGNCSDTILIHTIASVALLALMSFTARKRRYDHGNPYEK
jgi:hypothetical protein